MMTIADSGPNMYHKDLRDGAVIQHPAVGYTAHCCIESKLRLDFLPVHRQYIPLCRPSKPRKKSDEVS